MTTEWQLDDAESRFDDPLLGALVLLCRYYDRPQSTAALRAGLPLDNHLFTPELFIRAAKRAGFSAHTLNRPLKKITALHFPVVLLLKNQQACIVLSIDKDTQQADIIQPETGAGIAQINLETLEENYLGSAIFLRPQFQFDQRSAATPSNSNGHWYWRTIWQSWALYGEVIIASLLINLFALAAPLFVMNVYDRVVPNQAIETLWVLAVGAIIVFGFDFLMRTLRGYFIDVANKQADKQLAAHIFARVLNTRLSAQPRSAGAFANQLHEFDSFRDFFTSATLTTLIDLPFTFLFIAVIWHLSPPLALVPLIAMPSVLLLSVLIQIPLRHVVNKSLQAGAQKQASLVETLGGLETIKALGAEHSQQTRWEQTIAEISRYSLKSRFLSALTVNLALLIQQLAYVAIIVYGVYEITAGNLSMGALIACSILNGRALAPLGQLANLLARYHQSRLALQGLSHIMQQPVERETDSDFLHRPQLTGDIQFKDVDFRYADDELSVLNAVSFNIKAGEKVAIIGRIGSGKSTIARLLLGLYPPQAGHILVDGIDSRQLDPADCRRNIGYMPQDLNLFYGTVKDNMTFGAPYVDDDTILRAAKLAGVEDMIKQHPLGFAMPVGERGAGLSGGQRQGIALARAFLLEPPILLLDEPSNALDNQAEQIFKQRLDKHSQHQTLLIITHRASLLDLVDRLIVLDQGRVVADGEKQSVLDALAKGQVKLAD